MKLFFLALLLIFTFSACSGSTTDSNNNEGKDSKKSIEAFKKKSESVCQSVDQDSVLTIGAISSGATTDPGALVESLKVSEEEMDRYISKLELVLAPEKYVEKWESFIDENAAIRDTYPKLSEHLIELQSINEKVLADPPTRVDSLEDADEIMDEIDLLERDLEIRVNELNLLSEQMKIEECRDTVE